MTRQSELMFPQEFLNQIKELALKIARDRRGEDHLQDIHTLMGKFQVEQKELADEDAIGIQGNQWNELPDVAYYLACMMIVMCELEANYQSDESLATDEYQELQKAKEYVETAQTWLSEQARIRRVTIEELKIASITKYSMRLEKNKDAELNAVLKAIAKKG